MRYVLILFNRPIGRFNLVKIRMIRWDFYVRLFIVDRFISLGCIICPRRLCVCWVLLISCLGCCLRVREWSLWVLVILFVIFLLRFQDTNFLIADIVSLKIWQHFAYLFFSFDVKARTFCFLLLSVRSSRLLRNHISQSTFSSFVIYNLYKYTLYIFKTNGK
jgi:hypothetical protein